jgi:acyl-CoA dehydrogenase
MPFFQSPPRLGNQYADDPLVREYVERTLPPDVRAVAEAEYAHLGELAGGELYRQSLAEREREPELTSWDPWGERVDRIEVTPLWRRAQALAAEHGLVAAGYEPAHGPLARVHQHLLNYMVQASLDVYSCPLAMSDGAARTLLTLEQPTDGGEPPPPLAAEHRPRIERAVARLLSRDPAEAWTSGQWMTERTGGSDVGLSETRAVRAADGEWRLHGTKWFTSATTAEMALTLARPEGSGPGGRGLALFFVELRGDDGRLRGIAINRLKDKLGTRKVPTAELSLDGTPAIPLAGLTDGIKRIAPMLAITRTWNAVASAWTCRRAMALAIDYAGRRTAFGALLRDKPLHADTLEAMGAESEAAFHLAFRVAALAGRVEHGAASEAERLCYRLLTPIAKLATARQAVAVTSEALEAFGGAGYIEDTGLPRLLADAQVLPIWEGTTNVLSLDTLRAMASDGTFAAWCDDVRRGLDAASAVATARAAVDHAAAWLGQASGDPRRLEAGARRLALTLGRTTQLALLVAHAAWCLGHGRGGRAARVARRFAAAGIDLISGIEGD